MKPSLKQNLGINSRACNLEVSLAPRRSPHPNLLLLLTTPTLHLRPFSIIIFHRICITGFVSSCEPVLAPPQLCSGPSPGCGFPHLSPLISLTARDPSKGNHPRCQYRRLKHQLWFAATQLPLVPLEPHPISRIEHAAWQSDRQIRPSLLLLLCQLTYHIQKLLLRTDVPLQTILYLRVQPGVNLMHRMSRACLLVGKRHRTDLKNAPRLLELKLPGGTKEIPQRKAVIETVLI